MCGTDVRIDRSTLIAPLTPSSAPAVSASVVSGRTPTTTRTRSTSRRNSSDPETANRPPASSTRSTRHTGDHLDAGLLDPLPDQPTELRVDGGQHLGQRLHLRHLQPAGGQRLDHLNPDVSGPDDERLARTAVERRRERKGVGHGVQQEHPVSGAQPIEAVDRRADRDGAGADHQFVVRDLVAGPHGEPAPDRIDASGRPCRAATACRWPPAPTRRGGPATASAARHRPRGTGCRRSRSSGTGRRRPP